MLAVRAHNPGADIRFVFLEAHRAIRKGCKTTYAAWCDTHGFRWADRVILPGWLA